VQEEKRQKAERLHQQQKHENQMREMIGQCEANIRELQQLQVSPVKPQPPWWIAVTLLPTSATNEGHWEDYAC
jgi:hypothetical protein